MNSKIAKAIIFVISLIIIIIIINAVRNFFIVKKVFNVDTNSENYYFSEISYNNIEYIENKTEVYKYNKKMVIVTEYEGNKEKSYKDFETNILYMYSEEQNKYVEIEGTQFNDFYQNALLSSYTSESNLLKKYLFRYINAKENNYIFNIDETTYYVDKETYLITKVENSSGTNTILCTFNNVNEDIWDINY